MQFGRYNKISRKTHRINIFDDDSEGSLDRSYSPAETLFIFRIEWGGIPGIDS